MRIRTNIVAALAMTLLGCSDPVADAQRELEIVESTRATVAEVCDAKKKVAEAYLEAKDADGYAEAKLSADIVCLNAQFNPTGSYAELSGQPQPSAE